MVAFQTSAFDVQGFLGQMTSITATLGPVGPRGRAASLGLGSLGGAVLAPMGDNKLPPGMERNLYLGRIYNF